MHVTHLVFKCLGLCPQCQEVSFCRQNSVMYIFYPTSPTAGGILSFKTLEESAFCQRPILFTQYIVVVFGGPLSVMFSSIKSIPGDRVRHRVLSPLLQSLHVHRTSHKISIRFLDSEVLQRSAGFMVPALGWDADASITIQRLLRHVPTRPTRPSKIDLNFPYIPGSQCTIMPRSSNSNSVIVWSAGSPITTRHLFLPWLDVKPNLWNMEHVQQHVFNKPPPEIERCSYLETVYMGICLVESPSLSLRGRNFSLRERWSACSDSASGQREPSYRVSQRTLLALGYEQLRPTKDGQEGGGSPKEMLAIR
ncbi:hypothetical protein B0H14DRAFT_3694057 [Mycena olivaceomarginata]|nr:hypothetical protein B0H14DRAFT_3694057 [Mycena olivaceomarginata]